MKHDQKWRLDTLCLHAGQAPDPTTRARAVPIYQTTSYVFRDTAHAANLFALKEFGNVYTRIMNPTWEVLEARLAALEGGSGAVATASGQAAITCAVLNLARAGQNIVASASLYGGTYNLFRHTLPKLGVEVKFVALADPGNFARATNKNTRAFFCETLGNPKNDLADLAALAELAHRHALPLIVDNTVTTPYLLRPFAWGADIVVHSCTKFIGGHGTSVGGVVVESGKFDWGNGNFPEIAGPDPSYHGVNYWEAVGKTMGIAFVVKLRTQLLRDLGACLSPFNAFLFLQGLETLHLRMPRHCENALAVARWLKGRPEVTWVNYPGLEDHPSYELTKKYLPKGAGAIVGFGIRGGREAGRKLIDSVELLSHLANIGDAKSLIIHPATTTHQQLGPEEQEATGVTEDFVRLSVGLEDPQDICEALGRALEVSQQP